MKKREKIGRKWEEEWKKEDASDMRMKKREKGKVETDTRWMGIPWVECRMVNDSFALNKGVWNSAVIAHYSQPNNGIELGPLNKAVINHYSQPNKLLDSYKYQPISKQV